MVVNQRPRKPKALVTSLLISIKKPKSRNLTVEDFETKQNLSQYGAEHSNKF